MRVRIFNKIDLSTPLRDFETNQTNLTINELLEHSLQRYNFDNIKKYVKVVADGVEIQSAVWNKFHLQKTKNLAFIIEPQDFFSVAMLIIAIATAVYTMIKMKKLKTNERDTSSGSSIYDPNAQGNKAKLEDPIPEQFGLVKAFPDYISDKHYFYKNNVRYMSMLLCQGMGYFDHPLDQMFIGSTPVTSYVGSDLDIQIADPGEDISKHDAHKCWFNSTEITMSGKEVPATETSARKRGELIGTNATLNGMDLTIDANTDFVSGDIIRIYNLKGQDKSCAITSFESIVGSIRCYLDELPSDELNNAINWEVQFNITLKSDIAERSYSYPSRLINFGTDVRKGNFIDIAGVNIVDTEGYTVIAELVLKNWVYNNQSLTDSHLLDNGFYEIQAKNGNTLTVLAVEKIGISYVQKEGWASFTENRTSECIVELCDTGRDLKNAKSNVAGYYRACPIGATSRYYEIDFCFPSGLYRMNDQGDYKSRTATILLEYRIAGSTDEPTSITKVYTKSSPDAFGETIEIDVGNNDYAYEFRVTNQSEYSDDSQVMQTFMWNGLKCLISDDTSYPDVTVIALTVRGSESLSELSDNQISTLWTRKLNTTKDIKTITYEEKEVEGTDVYSYDYNYLYDTILNNHYYPFVWDTNGTEQYQGDDDAYYLPNYLERIPPSETYHKRMILLNQWKRLSDGYSINNANIHFTTSETSKSRTRTIISFEQEFYQEVSKNYYQYVSATQQELFDEPNKSINVSSSIDSCNMSFFFDAVNKPTRQSNTNGRFEKAFQLQVISNYRPNDWDAYATGCVFYRLALIMPAYASDSGRGVVADVRWVPYQWIFFDSKSMPDTTFIKGKIKIDHTAAYIRVYLDDEKILEATADKYPIIAFQFGKWMGFQNGGTYGSGGRFWKWYIGTVNLEIPTKYTIMFPTQNAVIAEDKEANRSIASPIKYICDNSKFGKIYDENNILALDEIWRKANLNFDFRFDKNTTVLDAIKQCMQVGFTEPIIDGNKIKGKYRSKDAYIEQMFTSANMIGEPKITYNFVTPTDADEIDITYMSPQTWKQDEIYLDINKATNETEVYTYQNSLNTERAELLAVTDVVKAQNLGARRLREVMFQRKQIDFDTEFDALNCNYGSLIAVAMPQDLNVYNGYILGYDNESLTLTLSDRIAQDTVLIYIRRYNGTVQQIPCTVIDEHHVQLSEQLDFKLSDDVKLDKPHYAVGNVEKYWVTSIKPSEKKCSVTAINYDARVFVDDPF